MCGHHVEGRIRCGRVQAGMQMLLQSVCRWAVLLGMYSTIIKVYCTGLDRITDYHKGLRVGVFFRPAGRFVRCRFERDD